jgi:hypothetical protein
MDDEEFVKVATKTTKHIVVTFPTAALNPNLPESVLSPEPGG